jgi:two-component system, sensor histidine kinase PdtaS
MAKIMKYILPVFIFFFCFNFVFCQYKKTDSLFVVLKSQKEDTTKVNTYHELCKRLEFQDLQKFHIYNLKLLQLSQKLKYQKGIAFYYWNLAESMATNNELEKAITISKKAQALLYNSKDWDTYFTYVSDLARILNLAGKYNETLLLLDNSLKRAIKNNHPENLIQIYNQLSALYTQQLRFKEGLIYAKKAISCETSEQLKRNSYINIATIYNYLKNYASAREYIDKVIFLTKDPLSKRRILITKITILIGEEKYNEALSIGLQNEKIFQEFKDQNSLIYNRNLIAICYYELKKYNEATDYITQCLNNQIKSIPNQIDVYNLASQIYLKTNKNKEALVMIDKALSLQKASSENEFKLEIYATKSEVEESLGHYQKALSYYKKQALLKEQKYVVSNKDKINELQVNFKVTDKDNSIKKLQIVQLQKTLENKKQKENLLYVSAALILALLSTFFYIRNNRAIKNKNKIIALTNVKLENEKLLSQKSLMEKETLLKEIHHRVKNNMQLVMSLLNIQAEEATNNINDFVAVSQSRILSMSLIHENLYQSENLNQVNFKEYIENLTQNILSTYNPISSNITLKLEIENVYFDIQKAIPLGLIINELINNAYKHAFINHQNGTIALKLIRRNDQYELIVSDNGIGIQKNKSIKKTLGLQLVNDLVFQLGGLLKIENKNGMTYEIQF